VEGSAAGQRQLRKHAPSVVLGVGTGNVATPHVGYESLGIVHHQVELVITVRIRGMNGDFRWRKAKDEPTVADIYMSEFQHVPQERTVGLRIGAVNDRMSANDHGGVLSWYFIMPDVPKVYSITRMKPAPPSKTKCGKPLQNREFPEVGRGWDGLNFGVFSGSSAGRGLVLLHPCLLILEAECPW
jgi:hypothetical protein